MTIADSTCKTIDQLIEVIGLFNDQEFIKPLDIYNGSTIGKHFRHIHDFYSCLLKGIEKGCVDYSHRERIELLENKPNVLISSLERIKSDIYDLNFADRLEVYGDFEFPNGERPIAHSSVGRELLYAHDHAVHHLAIIKLGIRAEFQLISIDDNIGVAASTIRHQNSQS